MPADQQDPFETFLHLIKIIDPYRRGGGGRAGKAGGRITNLAGFLKPYSEATGEKRRKIFWGSFGEKIQALFRWGEIGVKRRSEIFPNFIILSGRSQIPIETWHKTITNKRH